MHAIHVHNHGTADELQYEQTDRPDPAADEVLDPVDAVIDTVGGEVFASSLAVLRDGGAIATLPYGGPTAEDEQALAAHDGTVEVPSVGVRWNRDLFSEISALIEDGTVVPTTDTVLPLTEARQAHEILEGRDRHVRGKLVLQVVD